MSFEGTFTQGQVVFDQPPPLAEGTRVRVEAVSQEANGEGGTLETLLKYAGVVKDLPPDMARNHDHYIHGTPKR